MLQATATLAVMYAVGMDCRNQSRNRYIRNSITWNPRVRLLSCLMSTTRSHLSSNIFPSRKMLILCTVCCHGFCLVCVWTETIHTNASDCTVWQPLSVFQWCKASIWYNLQQQSMHRKLMLYKRSCYTEGATVFNKWSQRSIGSRSPCQKQAIRPALSVISHQGWKQQVPTCMRTRQERVWHSLLKQIMIASTFAFSSN